MKNFTSIITCSISNSSINEGDEYHIIYLSLYFDLCYFNQIKESDGRLIISFEKESLSICSLFLEAH
jgi:hypothetical protein